MNLLEASGWQSLLRPLLLWISQKPYLIIVLLCIKPEKQGKSFFLSFSLTASNKKRANLTWSPSEIMLRGQSSQVLIPLYAFRKSEKRWKVQFMIIYLILSGCRCCFSPEIVKLALFNFIVFFFPFGCDMKWMLTLQIKSDLEAMNEKITLRLRE